MFNTPVKFQTVSTESACFHIVSCRSREAIFVCDADKKCAISNSPFFSLQSRLHLNTKFVVNGTVSPHLDRRSSRMVGQWSALLYQGIPSWDSPLLLVMGYLTSLCKNSFQPIDNASHHNFCYCWVNLHCSSRKCCIWYLALACHRLFYNCCFNQFFWTQVGPSRW